MFTPGLACGASLLRALEVDRDGDALELESRPELVLDPVAVVARHEPRVVHEDAEPRRARGRLGAVQQLQAAAALSGWTGAGLLQLRQGAVERGGRDPRAVLREERLDVVEQAA